MVDIGESEPSILFYFIFNFYAKTDSFQFKLFVKSKPYSLGSAFLYAVKFRKMYY